MDRTSAEVQEAVLQAVSGISTDFDLRDLLAGVVRAACTLSGARYGALGVIGRSRRQLVEFVAEGMSAEQRARIGHLPTGRGLLGHLVTHHEPLRLDDLTAHPSSSGFPPGHPPMTTFLGVPVKVRGRVFGNLYLTEKSTGPRFTAEDERSVTALAGLAGLAIEHAKLLMTTERRACWLEATAAMPTDVLRANRPQDALDAVLRRALEGSGGTTALAIAPDGTGRFAVRAAVGDDGEEPSVVLAGVYRAAMLAMAADRARWADLPDGGAIMTRLAIDPLTRGALVVVLPRRRYAEHLGADADFITNFANQASLVLERHHTRTIQQQLAVLAERNRIARDLHDVVLQRLFALGLQLRTIERQNPGPLRTSLSTVLDDLDATVREIRHSIVDLRPTGDDRLALRAAVRDIVAEYAHVLGTAPTVRMDGPLDTLVDDRTRHHMLAVLREGLSNAARHAAARHVWVKLTVTSDELTCVVGDDGDGTPTAVARGGLRNLADRAAELGGRLDVAPRPGHGTVLTWCVPLGSTPPGDSR